MTLKKILLMLMAIFLIQSTVASHAAVVKNGVKCVKQGQIAKVGSKTFTCTDFYGSLMWASKGWNPPVPKTFVYENSYDLLMSYSDNRLWNLNYELVFSGSYASRSRAFTWCDDYFVTPSQFGRYYSYSSRDINQAILGCTDAVMRRDG